MLARTLAVGTAMAASMMSDGSEESTVIRKGLGAYANEAGAREALQKVQRQEIRILLIRRMPGSRWIILWKECQRLEHVDIRLLPGICVGMYR